MKIRQLSLYCMLAIHPVSTFATTHCPEITSQELISGKHFSPVLDIPKPVKDPLDPSLATYIDPVYGTCITRATDHAAELGSSAYAKHFYSRIQAFNSDDSVFLVRAQDGHIHMYDGNTHDYVPFPKGSVSSGLSPIPRMTGGSDPQWDPNDPNIIYYLPGQGAGMRIYRLDITKPFNEPSDLTSPEANPQIIHQLEGPLKEIWPDENMAPAFAWTRYEGSASKDLRYWAFQIEAADRTGLGAVVWDMQEGRIKSHIDYAEANLTNPDHLSISPSGKYVVIAFENPIGTVAYTHEGSTFTEHMRVNIRWSHADTMILANGNDGYISVDRGTSSNYPPDEQATAINGNARAFYVDLDTKEKHWLFENGEGDLGAARHYSGRAFDKPGWALISTYGGTLDRYARDWREKKIFAIELGGANRIVNLAHTQVGSYVKGVVFDPNSLGPDDTPPETMFDPESGEEYMLSPDYFSEPQATVNRDFTKIVFGSNFGAVEEEGTHFKDYSTSLDIDNYIIELPKDAISSMRVAFPYQISLNDRLPNSILALSGAQAADHPPSLQNANYYLSAALRGYNSSVSALAEENTSFKTLVLGDGSNTLLGNGILDELSLSSQELVLIKPAYNEALQSGECLISENQCDDDSSAGFLKYGEQLIQSAITNNQTPILSMGQPSEIDLSNIASYQSVIEELSEYQYAGENLADRKTIARSIPVKVIPTALAFANSQQEFPGISLYEQDGINTSQAGAMLAALTEYSFFTGKKYIDDAVFLPNAVSTELDDQTVRNLAKIAWDTLVEYGSFYTTKGGIKQSRLANDELFLTTNLESDCYWGLQSADLNASPAIATSTDQINHSVSVPSSANSLFVECKARDSANWSHPIEVEVIRDLVDIALLPPVMQRGYYDRYNKKSTTSVKLQLLTDSVASCRLGSDKNAMYDDLALQFSTVEGLTHYIDANVTLYDNHFYAQCLGENGIETEKPVYFYVRVGEVGIDPPVLTLDMESNLIDGLLPRNQENVDLRVHTDVPAECRFSNGEEGDYEDWAENKLDSNPAGTTHVKLGNSMTIGRYPHGRTVYFLCKNAQYEESITNLQKESFRFDFAGDEHAPTMQAVKSSIAHVIGGTQEAITVITNKPSDCRRHNSAGYRYDASGDDLIADSDRLVHTWINYSTTRDTNHYISCRDYIYKVPNQISDELVVTVTIGEAEPEAVNMSHGQFDTSYDEGTTSAVLELLTDVNASCRLGSLLGESFVDMTSHFSSTNGTTHTITVPTVSGNNVYYAHCQNTAEGTYTNNALRFDIAVGDVGDPIDPTGPEPVISVISDNSLIQRDQTVSLVTVSTDVEAACKWSDFSATEYNDMSSDNVFVTTDEDKEYSANVSISPTILEKKIYVRCENTTTGVINSESTEVTISYAGDDLQPQIFNINGDGEISQNIGFADITFETDKPSDCKYGLYPGFGHSQHNLSVDTEDGLLHRFIDNIYAPSGRERTFYVTCEGRDYRVPNTETTEIFFKATGDQPAISIVGDTITIPRGTSNFTVVVATDVAAECKLGHHQGYSYASMSNIMTANGSGNEHSLNIALYQDKTVYVRCLNTAENLANNNDKIISLKYAGDEHAPDLNIVTGGFPAGTQEATINYSSGTSLIQVEFSTGVASTCKYNTTPGYDYSTFNNELSSADGLSHTLSYSSWDGMNRSLFIRCQDDQYNVSNSTDFILHLSVEP